MRIRSRFPCLLLPFPFPFSFLFSRISPLLVRRSADTDAYEGTRREGKGKEGTRELPRGRGGGGGSGSAERSPMMGRRHNAAACRLRNARRAPATPAPRPRVALGECRFELRARSPAAVAVAAPSLARPPGFPQPRSPPLFLAVRGLPRAGCWCLSVRLCSARGFAGICIITRIL